MYIKTIKLQILIYLSFINPSITYSSVIRIFMYTVIKISYHRTFYLSILQTKGTEWQVVGKYEIYYLYFDSWV